MGEDFGPTNYRWSVEIDGDVDSFEVSSSTHDWSYTGAKDGSEWVVYPPTYGWKEPEEVRFSSEAVALVFAITALLESFMDGSDGAAAAERAMERSYER